MLLVLGILLMGGTAMPTRVRAQISPGALARAHRELEGATNCVKCHGLKREPMAQLCLNCHKEVQWLMDQGRGLHTREVKNARKDCASCHPDHAGVDFKLIAWPDPGGETRFDHRKAGWVLDGKHTETKCADCHVNKFRVSQAATLSPRKAGSAAGWMGLETTCISCHKVDDAHNGKLSARCETCHDTKSWEKAPKFSHDSSDYPLTGKHADVECDKCHLMPKLAPRTNDKGEKIPVFKPVPFRECSNCHVDPHKGRMTGKCVDCHVTRGWEVVDKRDFNHGATRYPLRGKHAAVDCAACHGPNLSKKDPPFVTCAGCHADVHNGEAKIAGAAADCASCHRVEGFTPSTFTVAQHRNSAYALEGKHATVKCTACHTAQTVTIAGASKRSARMRPPYSVCTSCHADVHGGQLAGRADKGACEGCHTVAGFKPSTYGIAQHAALRLALDGRHAQVECAACHAVGRKGLPPIAPTLTLGTAKVALRIPELSCEACHVDVHAGRFSKGAAALAGGCAACHGTTTFSPSTIDVANHNRFALKLEGGHRAVPCVQCHQELTGSHASNTLLLTAANVRRLPFGATRTTCVACHETPHGDQFAGRKDKGACDACHGVDGFAPAARFDHDRDASFKLQGAHAKVACAECHKAVVSARGASIVQYRGVPSKCESCHGGKTPSPSVERRS
ncbi:MAG: cytochrome c3 family protein [Gemmatimonadaceae bacterium]